jgi:ornithine cyclodeaminase
MPEIKILSESELRHLIPLDLEAVTCIEDAFAALAGGAVVMPPIMRLDIHEANGEVDSKTAYIPGLDSLAVKISAGFFGNPALGLATCNGLMVLLSAKTGVVEAVLLDNGYLTDLRTAAAGAVAAKHLSRPDAKCAAIIGTGLQARMQLQALSLVRPIKHARIWGRDPRAAQAMARDVTEAQDIGVSVASSVHEAVSGSDIIVTATPASKPLVHWPSLEPGQHVTAMGSDAEHKNEIDPEAIARADIYVADSLAQTRILGELHHAISQGFIDNDASLRELGEIITGKPGRASPEQISICDLTGTGVQDTAIATLARKRALDQGVGTAFFS